MVGRVGGRTMDAGRSLCGGGAVVCMCSCEAILCRDRAHVDSARRGSLVCACQH